MTVIQLDQRETFALETLLSASAEDLADPVGLLRTCGFDDHQLFEHMVVSGLDFRASNISGLSFYGATLDGAAMYRDQYEVIKATGPRSANGVRLFDREGGAATLAEFVAELAVVARAFEATGHFDSKPLQGILRRIPELDQRALALQSVIDLGQEVLSPTLVEIAARNASDQILEARGGKEAPLAYLAMRLVSRDTIADRLALLDTTLGDVDLSRSFIQALLGRGIANVTMLESAIAWLSRRGIQPHSLLFLGVANVTTEAFEVAGALAALDVIEASGATQSSYLFFLLLQRVRTFTDARRLLTRIREAGLRIDPRLYSAVAERARGLAEVQETLRMMAVDGLQPTAVIFAQLVNAVRDLPTAREILSMMSEVGVLPDAAVFYRLPEKTSSLADALQVLDLMRDADVAPDAVVFTKIAEKARSLVDARQVLDRMREVQVRPDNAVFTRLADKAKTMADLHELAGMMREADVSPDVAVFSRLAEVAQTMEEVDLVLGMMAELKIAPSNAVFSRLADGTKSMADARQLLVRLRQARLVPDTTVFSRLADKARTPGEAREFLGLMQEVDVDPTRDILSSLVGACLTLTDAAPFLDRIRQKREKPGIFDMNKLLHNTPGAYEAERVYQAISDYGLLPDHYSFNILVAKQESYAASRAVASQRRPAGVRIDLFALNPMLRKSEKLSHVLETLEDISRANLVPDSYSVKALLGAPLSSDDLRAGFARMVEIGLRVETVDMSRLGDKAGAFADVMVSLGMQAPG